MRVLLTGATGFIGRRLATRLIARGDSVLAVGRRPCRIAGAEEIPLPHLEPERIEMALQRTSFDGVVHLAAAGVNPAERDEKALMTMNSVLPGMMISIAAKRGAKAVVTAGSCAEYQAAPVEEALTEQSALETRKLYGASKAAGGILALAQGAGHGIPVAVVRLFNVFGPGEAPYRLLPSLLQSLTAGRPVRLSAGTQVRDFVYIDDVCAGLMAVLETSIRHGLPSAAYNLATGKGNTVADFARATARLMGADEALLEFNALPFRPDDMPYVVGDASLLKQHCGWTAAFTMKDGIAAAIQEYQAARLDTKASRWRPDSCT
jgi:nucleoside-diphosphate-sugar epimerase